MFSADVRDKLFVAQNLEVSFHCIERLSAKRAVALKIHAHCEQPHPLKLGSSIHSNSRGIAALYGSSL
jgi:hypothetical protein